MADNDQQAQGSGTATEGSQDGSSQRSGESSGGTEDRSVPYHRFKEVNDKNKDLEKRLQAVEQEKEQQQEDRATKQGEYQELADKRQKKIVKLEEELKTVKSEWARERRMNVWARAAQGIVKPEAIADAFSFLSEDDLASADESDDSAFEKLAQNLVEVRSYLQAEGPKGAGSGGSRQPVLAGADGQKPSGRKQLFKSSRRPSWK